MKKIATNINNGRPCSLVVVEEAVANQKGYHVFECSCGLKFMTQYYAAFHVKKNHQGEKPENRLKISCNLSWNLAVLESLYTKVSDNVYTYLHNNEETHKRKHDDDELDSSTPAKRLSSGEDALVTIPLKKPNLDYLTKPLVDNHSPRTSSPPLELPPENKINGSSIPPPAKRLPSDDAVPVTIPPNKPNLDHITKPLVDKHSPRTPSPLLDMPPESKMNRFSISSVDVSPHSDSDGKISDYPEVSFDLDNPQLSDPRVLPRPKGSVYHKKHEIVSDLPVIYAFMFAHRQIAKKELTIGPGTQQLIMGGDICALLNIKNSSNDVEVVDPSSAKSQSVPKVRQACTFSFKFLGEHNQSVPVLIRQQSFARNNQCTLLDGRHSSNADELKDLSRAKSTIVPASVQKCAFSFKLPSKRNSSVSQMVLNTDDNAANENGIASNTKSWLTSWNGLLQNVDQHDHSKLGGVQMDPILKDPSCETKKSSTECQATVDCGLIDLPEKNSSELKTAAQFTDVLRDQEIELNTLVHNDDMQEKDDIMDWPDCQLEILPNQLCKKISPNKMEIDGSDRLGDDDDVIRRIATPSLPCMSLDEMKVNIQSSMNIMKSLNSSHEDSANPNDKSSGNHGNRSSASPDSNGKSRDVNKSCTMPILSKNTNKHGFFQQGYNSSDVSVATDVLHDLLDLVSNDNLNGNLQINKESTKTENMLALYDNREQSDENRLAVMSFLGLPNSNVRNRGTEEDDISCVMKEPLHNVWHDHDYASRNGALSMKDNSEGIIGHDLHNAVMEDI